MQSTRSQSESAVPKTYVLDFFLDDKGGCALTARINDTRFHIVVDPAMLKSEGHDEVLEEYRHHLHAVESRSCSQRGTPGSAHARSNTSTEKDSGIDLAADHGKTVAEAELQNWLLSCFADETSRLAPASSKKHRTSLKDWYNAPVHYYEVLAKGTELQPKPLDENSELRKRIDELFPALPLPRSLRGLGIPVFAALDLTVGATSDEPPPFHPSILRSKDNKTYFFKPVDPTQPQPTKREIKYLHEIQSLGLHEEINVPQLLGLVTTPQSSTKIMGILLSVIEDPMPLTMLLDSEVDEPKRKRWAKESKRVVKLLHEHGIVWGDAKADNFMVDKNDDLWIIDFGGSYTEGWVDPENMETIEGDDEGTEKVVNALRDPDGATFDMEEEEKERQKCQSSDEDRCGAKRKRDDVDDDSEEVSVEPLRKIARNPMKSDSSTEQDEADEYCV